MDIAVFSQVFGGIGLFLIGMVLATDGLRSASGDALRRLLLRFTGGPFKALASGTLVTAVVQSSSATTVATIGFVSAGLLTFHQALGLILGANLGTTATGWIVALLGLKFTVSTVALPLVGVGATMRLFARGRMRDIGIAIAGFGIIFVGLDVLQAGMASSANFITPDTLPSDTWTGRTLLVGLGIGLTAVMQSSSAAIATTLTALHAGSISMLQAAAIAIGVNIGTTVTAGLAAIGAGTSARRTAFAHLIFNSVTGLVAFALLPLLVEIISLLGTTIESTDATLTLAAFHTAFNIIGVALFFPFLKRFAHFVERVIPDRESRFTSRLHASLTSEGGLAIEAVRSTAFDMAIALVSTTQQIMHAHTVTEADLELVAEVAEALVQTNQFVGSIRDLDHVGEHTQARLVDVIHALDRLDELARLLTKEADLLAREVPPELVELRKEAHHVVDLVDIWLNDEERGSVSSEVAQAARSVAASRKVFRDEMLQQTALGDASPEDAGEQIDTARHLDQLSYYLWRLSERLVGERKVETSESDNDDSSEM